ncbi:hypothetical protein [Lysobacter gummosus]|uniref:hypothetical protein n=1 Tax=Lysobacter gummosus TaxID=262324 RepID=UPI003643222A
MGGLLGEPTRWPQLGDLARRYVAALPCGTASGLYAADPRRRTGQVDGQALGAGPHRGCRSRRGPKGSRAFRHRACRCPRADADGTNG